MGKLDIRAFSKIYKVYFSGVAAAGTETAEIDLDNDLDLQRNEGIVLGKIAACMQGDVPFTDPESNCKVFIRDEQVGDSEAQNYPTLKIPSVGAATAVEGNGNGHVEYEWKWGQLMPRNFYISCTNLDTTTAHNVEAWIEYYVVDLNSFDLEDVYSLLRGQAPETT
jgi:hypothetical protein